MPPPPTPSGAAKAIPRGRATASEDEAPVRDGATHTDRLVDADRGSVLGADEQADPRHVLEQAAAEIAHAALRVAAAACGGINPDLLQLNRLRRPRRCLRLEQDRALLQPDPRSPLCDLGLGSPAEAVRVAVER